MTLDPDFVNNGFVYVYYTASSPVIHNRISRLTASGDVASGGETVILDLPSVDGALYHMGGALHFGADGKLYIATGDHEALAVSQSLSSAFGKVLRINSDGSIPSDNPFYTQTTGIYRAIYARGFRNPFTFAFQPGTGRLFINDVGAETYEEIDDGTPGANYGWPNSEGPNNTNGYTAPFYYYDHTVGQAIDSAVFYDPPTSQFPALYQGKYFFSDYGAGWMKTIDLSTRQVTTFATGIVAPVDSDVGPDGTLYYLARGATLNAGYVGHIVFQADAAPIITTQPAPQSAAVGESVTFSVTATGSGLNYQWQRNQMDIDGATAASYTVDSVAPGNDGDKFRVIVSNANGSTPSNEATLTVIANHAPIAAIVTPAVGTTYRCGDTINYSGTGTDPEDGTLPASAFTWQVDYYTGGLDRPFIGATSGSTSGSFVVPTFGPYTKSDVFYRIMLTVTDSGGRSHTVTRDIQPIVATVTLASNVPGIALAIDGQPKPAPFSFSGVANFQRDIGAPTPQLVNGVVYEFDGWSDGGAVTHTISTPDVNTTYTATFQPVLTAFLSDLPFVTMMNGNGPVERDTSNGEGAAGDGHTITLQGVPYAKGLGVHAPSDVSFDLGGNYWRFVSDIGIDDEVLDSGSVVFIVYADNQPIYTSPVMHGYSDTLSLDLNVTGAQTLRLVVTNAGDNTMYDHADWANARLLKRAVTVSSGSFHYETAPHSVSLVFNANVQASLSLDDIMLENLTSGLPISSGDMHLAYDTDTNTATITFPGLAGGILANGNYRLTVLSAGVTDSAGNPMLADFTFDFFHLTGDANHDGHVNLLDFNIFAVNFNQSNRTFAQGDFNYDGVVNLLDFNLLGLNFNTSSSVMTLDSLPKTRLHARG